MKAYQVVIYKMGVMWYGSTNEQKFTQFLNTYADAGWRVVSVQRGFERFLLIGRRHSYTVVLERDR